MRQSFGPFRILPSFSSFYDSSTCCIGVKFLSPKLRTRHHHFPPVTAHMYDLSCSLLADSGRNFLDRRFSADFQRSQDEARRVTQSIAIAKQPFDRSASLPASFAGSPRSSGVGSPCTQSAIRNLTLRAAFSKHHALNFVPQSEHVRIA